jgi:hypothetical protein
MDSTKRLGSEGERRSRRLVDSLASCAPTCWIWRNVSTWNHNAQRIEAMAPKRSRKTTSGDRSRILSTADTPSPHSPAIATSLNRRSL